MKQYSYFFDQNVIICYFIPTPWLFHEIKSRFKEINLFGRYHLLNYIYVSDFVQLTNFCYLTYILYIIDYYAIFFSINTILIYGIFYPVNRIFVFLGENICIFGCILGLVVFLCFYTCIFWCTSQKKNKIYSIKIDTIKITCILLDLC